MKEHMVFIRKYYESGHFVASGRKAPRDGGIILGRRCQQAADGSNDEEDPFYGHGLIEFRIAEFVPNQKARNIAELIR